MKKYDFTNLYGCSIGEYCKIESNTKKCESAGIPCEEINPVKFFDKYMCDATFITKVYTYDAFILRDHILEEVQGNENIDNLCTKKPQTACPYMRGLTMNAGVDLPNAE